MKEKLLDSNSEFDDDVDGHGGDERYANLASIAATKETSGSLLARLAVVEVVTRIFSSFPFLFGLHAVAATDTC